MTCTNSTLQPAELLVDHGELFTEEALPGPVLDLACGEGHNGIFLAVRNVPVICCDISQEALDRAADLAEKHGARIRLWHVDLEREGVNPLPEDHYGGILVFRYLHRPLMPCIKKALKEGGILMYETFTTEQARFGKPRHPDHLLKPSELREWFEDWETIHTFEGLKDHPQRAVAQLVCRKPSLRAG